jgi:uracil DNA glycosylase
LSDRKQYRNALGLQRVTTIKNRVNEYRPTVVIFYGNTMKEYWDQITDEPKFKIISILGHPVKFSQKNGTSFFQCPHPRSRSLNSIGKSFWIDLGNNIRGCLNK